MGTGADGRFPCRRAWDPGLPFLWPSFLLLGTLGSSKWRIKHLDSCCHMEDVEAVPTLAWPSPSIWALKQQMEVRSIAVWKLSKPKKIDYIHIQEDYFQTGHFYSLFISCLLLTHFLVPVRNHAMHYFCFIGQLALKVTKWERPFIISGTGLVFASRISKYLASSPSTSVFASTFLIILCLLTVSFHFV